MSDFETHEIGTARELKLSRDLAIAIDNAIFDKVELPPRILEAYKALNDHYMRHWNLDYWQINKGT